MDGKLRKTRSGQVTLLALLLGVLGLTIGLSVASRSLSDLKQASYVDFGTKALAAAEAGAEYGLYWLSQQNPAPSVCTNGIDAMAQTSPASWATLNISSILVNVCPDANRYFNKTVASDDVLQANMTSQNGNNFYYVLWENTAPAAQITVLYKDYSIKRFAYNSGVATQAPWTTDNFATAGGPTGVANCPAGLDYQSGQIPALNGAGNYAIQIRAKPLGGSSTVQICGDGNGVPAQQYIVTSTATTRNSVTKKIQVTEEINGTLPSIFDNVIFSGGNLIK